MKTSVFLPSLAAIALVSCIAPPKDGPPAARPGSPESIGATPAAAAPAAAPPPATEGAAPARSIAAGTPIGGGYKECGADGALDDGEDGNNQNLPVGDRGGYWYTFRDKKGTSIEPAAGEDGGTFEMSAGGHASARAARFHGKIGTGAPLFGGMGMNFVDPKAAYDASKYAGIAFWAKRSDSSTGKVRLKVPDSNTDPDGGVCTECFNDFGYDLNLTAEWKQYVFPWKTMRQMPGWGTPRKPQITPAKIYGIQFQVNVPSANYDIYIDDLKFICQ